MIKQYQSGFALVTAIFLIVVLALLAGFIATIGSVQKTTSVFALVGSRAQFAAISGVEWGVHHVLNFSGGPACFASPTTFAISGGASGNFDVTLTCAEVTITEGASPSYLVFDIEAIAQFGTSGQEDYFSRRITASVTTAP
ncbi:MAG: pilus assembly protein MshP [Proteobacteria bacterium]|nr:pilus assembly protein MshP [Pseudomonadota bacterium]